MTIENKLFELSTLTDYGTQYLLDRHELTNMYLGDFMELHGLDDYDLMDEIDTQNLVSYVRDLVLNGTIDADEVVYSEDMVDYVRDNCSVDEVFDRDEVINFIQSEYTVDELVEWK